RRGAGGALPGEPPLPAPPPARAVLRAGPRGRGVPRALSGGVLAPGVVVGGVLPAAAGVSRDPARRAAGHAARARAEAPGVALRGAAARSARGPIARVLALHAHGRGHLRVGDARDGRAGAREPRAVGVIRATGAAAAR